RVLCRSPGQGFGSRVAISGTLAVIGTYVYDLTRLTPPVPIAAFTNYPWSLAISGTRVVVGEPQEDSGAASSGRAYIYDVARSNSTVPVFILNNPSPGPEIGDWFGASVAISGSRVVVGAPYDDTPAYNAGSVYVYDLANAAPTVPIMTLHVPAPGEVGTFGYSLAISGSRLVIGAYAGTGPNFLGSAYVYDLASASPTTPLVKLENPSPAAYDRFGEDVAISGSRVVIGGMFAQSAYVYNISRPRPGVAIATIPH